jgi:peptide/nickel transport system ATP-binding protein
VAEATVLTWLDVPEVGAPPPEPASDVLLEVRGLTIAFPTDRGLVRPVRNISFRLLRGQRVGLVGESGSGKSLTALSLMRLVRSPGYIESGEIFLNGRDLIALDERDMAQVRGGEMAMVYQNPMSALNPVRTIGHQIVEAIRLHEDVGPAAARAQAVELLRSVGVADAGARFDSYPHQFSGGMRQRVMIAMAMCANPDLLIADEPTTALDVTTQARIIELLLRLVEERNTAVMLITHDLGVAAGFCSDLQVMYAGRLVEKATAEAFYARPTHPYSEALLQSICRLEADVDAPMPAIPGQPPLPGLLPPGCPFHPRCPYAIDVCPEVEPRPERFRNGDAVVAECHRAEERYAAAATGREPA